MNYRKEEIKQYFKDWVAAFGSHHLDIIKFLKENKSFSKTKSEDEIWIDTFDLVHQEAFPANKPIIENPSAAKAFLGDETKKVRQFVKAFEENRYRGFEEDNIWKMKETNILDDVELVNKYFFIIGEEIVKEWMEDPTNY